MVSSRKGREMMVCSGRDMVSVDTFLTTYYFDEMWAVSKSTEKPPPPFFVLSSHHFLTHRAPILFFFFKRTTPVPFLHTQEATTTKATAPAKESNAAAAALAADERVPAKAAATNPARAADAADAADAATPKQQQQQRKQKTVKLCVYGAGVDTDPCAAAVASALSPAPFSCVAAPSAQACAVAVARGDADVVRLGSDDTHAARSRPARGTASCRSRRRTTARGT